MQIYEAIDFIAFSWEEGISTKEEFGDTTYHKGCRLPNPILSPLQIRLAISKTLYS